MFSTSVEKPKNSYATGEFAAFIIFFFIFFLIFTYISAWLCMYLLQPITADRRERVLPVLWLPPPPTQPATSASY